MEIKDFAVGDKVYLLNFKRDGRIENAEVYEQYVIKVGKKYVYTAGSMDSMYHRRFKKTDWNTEGAPFLKEDIDFGYPAYLFKSPETLCAYKEHAELERWFRRSDTREKHYTLEQLRLVRNILESPKGLHKALEQALTASKQGIHKDFEPLMQILTSPASYKEEMK